MFRFYGIVGLLSIMLAYALSLFNPFSKILDNFLLMVGMWLFFDAVDFKINKTSLLHKIKSKTNIVFYLILIGTLTGLFIEFFGAFVSHLWWEPFYTWLGEKPIDEAILLFFSTAIMISYVPLLPTAYSIYRILNHSFGKYKLKNIKLIKNKNERYAIFRYLGCLGLFFIILPLPLVGLLDLTIQIRGILILFPMLGLWFLLEYVEYSQHKRSLLMDLLDFRTGKLAAVCLTSILLGLLIEGMNLFTPAWIYKNYPLSSFEIFGIPVIILLGWIPLIIILLSFYRAFIKENDNLF